jgi:S-formylglutathione hydrolase FrmB
MGARARWKVAALAAVAVTTFGVGASSAFAKSPAIRFASGDGLTIKSVKQVDPRLFALTFTTKEIPVTLNLRILVPSDYAAHRHVRYPVLYLYHGTSGTASDWTVKGNAEQATAGKNLIVVMPDIAINDGGGGWCANWPGGKQNWETYLINQLLPWVQTNLRTLNTRGERAIAGLSQGGFCSLALATRHPQLFGEALAFSGVPDIAWDPLAHVGSMAIINATEVAFDGVAPDSMFGDPLTDFLNWADHDPATLANNLRWTKMYLYFGDGLPGAYDTAATLPDYPTTGGIEGMVGVDNDYFHARLDALHITPAVYHPYGSGTHSWPYWDRDLEWAIAPLMSDFAHPAPSPRSFTFQTESADYALYGWSVVIDRQANEFSTLSVTRAGGFSLAGSGTATVTTPSDYSRGKTYRVTTTNAGSRVTVQIVANAGGKLVIPVDLGPSDTLQEYTLGEPPAQSFGTTVYSAAVSITRSSRGRR